MKRWKYEGGYRGARGVLAGSGGVGSVWMAIGCVFSCDSPFPPGHSSDIFYSLLSTVLQVDLSMSTIPTLFPCTMTKTSGPLELQS